MYKKKQQHWAKETTFQPYHTTPANTNILPIFHFHFWGKVVMVIILL